jgi:prepilin-type N-terminal cleavage/methylation domain-containing protein
VQIAPIPLVRPGRTAAHSSSFHTHTFSETKDMRHKDKRGFTLIELLVVVAIIALLVGLLLPALAKAQKNARSMKDQTQIRQIHTASLTFANENKGKLPTPGLINRLTDPYMGQDLPGIGPEQYAHNHSAPLYSAMVAAEYYNTDILIGPTEQNPVVVEDQDYDYSDYDPGSDVYWDPDFLVELEDGPECNSSYSHLALCGQRKRVNWQDTQNSGDPCYSTRGTRDGATEGDEYDLSPTLLLHGSKRKWDGNVVFNDNHAELLDNFFPPLTVYEPLNGVEAEKDNIFAAEFDDYPEGNQASADAFLVICEEATQYTIGTPLIDNLLN